MSENPEFETAINEVIERFSNPEITKSLANFTRTLKLEFPDIKTLYVLNIENGQLKEVKKESVEKADISVSMNSDTFIGVINKTISPVKAYMTGKIKVKGSMSDLLKLRKVLF
ncbi:MAG: SCP2 sterol-binding domain-containing protein [Candidatus Njordarchaeales archaeon]